MTKCWIVCATEETASIFACDSLEFGIYPVDDIRSDGPDDGFPAKLASLVEAMLGASDVSRVVLCADHSFMVELKKALHETVLHSVIGSVEQDLSGVNESDLVPYVANFIIDANREERDAKQRPEPTLEQNRAGSAA